MYHEEINQKDSNLELGNGEAQTRLGADLYNLAVHSIDTAPGITKTRLNFHYSNISNSDSKGPDATVEIFYYEKDDENNHQLKQLYLALDKDQNNSAKFKSKSELPDFKPYILKSFNIDTKKHLLNIFSSIGSYYTENNNKDFTLLKSSNHLLNHILKNNRFLDDSVKDDHGNTVAQISDYDNISDIFNVLMQNSNNYVVETLLENRYTLEYFIQCPTLSETELTNFINNVDFTQILNNMGWNNFEGLLNKNKKLYNTIFENNLIDPKYINDLEPFENENTLSKLMKYTKFMKELLFCSDDIAEYIPINPITIKYMISDDVLLSLALDNAVFCINMFKHIYGKIYIIDTHIKSKIIYLIHKNIIHNEELSREFANCTMEFIDDWMLNILCDYPRLLLPILQNEDTLYNLSQNFSSIIEVNTQIKFLKFINRQIDTKLKTAVYRALPSNHIVLAARFHDPDMFMQTLNEEELSTVLKEFEDYSDIVKNNFLHSLNMYADIKTKIKVYSRLPFDELIVSNLLQNENIISKVFCDTVFIEKFVFSFASYNLDLQISIIGYANQYSNLSVKKTFYKQLPINKQTISIFLENEQVFSEILKDSEKQEELLNTIYTYDADTQIDVITFIMNDEYLGYELYYKIGVNKTLIEKLLEDENLTSLILDDLEYKTKYDQLNEMDKGISNSDHLKRLILFNFFMSRLYNENDTTEESYERLSIFYINAPITDFVIKSAMKNNMMDIILDDPCQINNILSNYQLFNEETRAQLDECLQEFVTYYELDPYTNFRDLDFYDVTKTKEFEDIVPNFEINLNKIQNPIERNLLKFPRALITYFHDLYRGASDYWFELRNGLYTLDKRMYYLGFDDRECSMNNMYRTRHLSEMESTVTNSAGLTLYRGLGNYNSIDYMLDLPIGTFNREHLNVIQGKKLFDRSFTSYSIQRSRAKVYANYNTRHMQTDPQKILLIINVPEDKRINMIPIGGEHDEIVLNRYQKLLVNDVKYGNVDDETDEDNFVHIYCTALDDNDENIEEEIYSTSYFQKYQEEFEMNLGKYLYNEEGRKRDSGLFRSVQDAINFFKGNCPDDPSKEDYYANIFFSNDEYTDDFYAGNVTYWGGANINLEEIEAILRDDVSNDEDLKSESTTVTGNLREKMAVLSFALDKDKNIKSMKLPPIDAVITRRGQTEEMQKKLRKDLDYQDKMGLYRSARERRYQKYSQKFHSDLLELNKSPLTYGKMLFQAQFAENDVHSIYGKRLLSGISGTTKRMLHRYNKYIARGDKKKLLDFRLALMAYMLPEEQHSLYEILVGSHWAGVIGNENLSTADTMDKSIDPLDENTIKNKVCKNREFPYEMAYKKYMQERIQQ